VGLWGSYLNISNPKLSVQMIVGYIFYPVAFPLGVERMQKAVIFLRSRS
jgi:CNT family concentrative nucleoside transporter